MLAVRTLNNNAVICKDCTGQEMIAMGKGIGFGKLPREVPLEKIERTFYDIDRSYHPLLQEIPADILEFTGKIVEIARNELPYELSPNLVVTLADHISFAVERARKNIRVKMPAAYDVRHSFPKEYEIGKYTVYRIQKEFQVWLPKEEIIGIAMGILNSKVTENVEAVNESERDEEMLEGITDLIEGTFHIMVDRDSFNFARYATHMRYLFQRIHTGKTIQSENLSMYKGLKNDYPQIAGCVDRIAAHIAREWDYDLNEEEKLYLMLHINRVCTKEGV